MTSETKGTFRVESWSEEVFSEIKGGPSLKRARIEKIYTGDIEGRGIVEYQFYYETPNTAQVYGLERFEGRVEDKNGSFVMEHTGHFENGVAELTWDVVVGSGTGDFKTFAGSVEFKAGTQQEYEITLEHHLRKENHLWQTLLEKKKV